MERTSSQNWFWPEWPCSRIRAAQFSRSGRPKCGNLKNYSGKNVRARLKPFNLNWPEPVLFGRPGRKNGLKRSNLSLEVDHLFFGGRGVEDLRKKFLQSLYSQKKSCKTNGYKECVHSSKRIACTTGQWEKCSCTNQFFHPPPQRSNGPSFIDIYLDLLLTLLIWSMWIGCKNKWNAHLL